MDEYVPINKYLTEAYRKKMSPGGEKEIFDGGSENYFKAQIECSALFHDLLKHPRFGEGLEDETKNCEGEMKMQEDENFEDDKSQENDGLQEAERLKIREKVEDLDSHFNATLSDSTRELNINSITDYVLETGEIPLGKFKSKPTSDERSLEQIFEKSRQLESDIKALFIEGQHKEYYSRLNKVAVKSSRLVGLGRKIESWANEKAERETYQNSMDWLGKHIRIFESEQAKAEQKYAESSNRIEDLRLNILDDGFALHTRKIGLESLDGKLDYIRKRQLELVHGSDKDKQQLIAYHEKAFEYQTDLPKFQKEIMRLESGIQTRWLQLSQARASRLIAYKNLVLFSKAAIVFDEIKTRINSLYEMSSVGAEQAPFVDVAQGIKDYEPVQRRLNELTEMYANLAEDMPATMDDLMASSSELNKCGEDIFSSSLSGKSYDSAMEICEKVRDSFG